VTLRCRWAVVTRDSRSGIDCHSDPGVLGAAAPRGVHDQLALAQRDTVRPPGVPDLFAVVDGERSKVDVARTHAIVDQRRVRGKHDRRWAIQLRVIPIRLWRF